MPREDDDVDARRVLWAGPHFGRLTRAGRAFLLRNGWERLDGPPVGFDDGGRTSGGSCAASDDKVPLAFVWPSKSGPQFPVDSATPALVRPYPTSLTSVVDDKVRLASLMEHYGVMPPSISSPSEAKDDKLYYVKHRHGAQGKSVHVHTKKTLSEWDDKCSNRADYVIQEEVEPKLDKEGRKFVLRAHVVLHQRGCSDGGGEAAHSLRAGLHEDVICHTHTVPYDPTSTDRIVHVSQAGQKKKRTSGNAPLLVSELDPSHPASGVFGQIKECSSILVNAMAEYLSGQPDVVDPGVSVFALLGIDYLVDKEGSVRLCEVNSHPALGWGTMSDVSGPVFVRLVEETLSIVLLDQSWGGTGFWDLDMGSPQHTE